MAYAERTTVTPEKTRGEIETVLARYGADSFAYLTDPTQAAVAFRMNGRAVRFHIPLDVDPAQFHYTKGRQRRSNAQVAELVQGEIRRRWRALLLCVKGKLEAVESGITTFEEEFLAHLVLPSGQTVAEQLVPEIDRAISAGEMPSFGRLALPRGD